MKLALIGSYGHVGAVLNGCAELPDVELVAAARWGPDDPLGFLGAHPAAPANLAVYDDYRRMLDEVRPDVVGVFMPLYRNAEASIAAAEHGCHVISEKPLATTLEDLAALRQAVAGAGVRINALLAMRGEPAYQAVRQVVAAGRIGEPVLAYGQKSYPFATRDDYYKLRGTYGGSIPWAAIHAIDFVSYCTGKEYGRVMATQSNAAHPAYPGMEDAGGILLDFLGGGHALISFDYLRPWSEAVRGRRSWGDERLRIAGTEGMVQIAPDPSRVELTTPTAVEVVPLPAGRDLFAEFLAAIRGEGHGLITPAESFRATEVALKAREAADSGRILEL
jgi:predicted dehydrogenase